MQNGWESLRVVHSKGGLRIINEYSSLVKIYPHVLDENQVTFNIASYHDFFPITQTYKLPIIGVEFYIDSRHFEGNELPEWRVFSSMSSNPWMNNDGAQLWSDIATSAYKHKYGELLDISLRISYQLRVSAWKLKQISVSYHNQLRGKIKNKTFKNNEQFDDSFTWLCYLSIQSSLVEMCILRDYLSEYTAHCVFNNLLSDTSSRIATFSSFRKCILNKNQLDDALFLELKQISEGSGWLKNLGEYRDLVVHSAPLTHAENRIFAICKSIEFDGVELPTVCCPIPPNPMKISKLRAKGALFEDFEEQLKIYSNLNEEHGPFIDGLEYCHTTLNRMSELAVKLAERSPVEPQRMVFDKSNIIGEVRIEEV